MNGLINRQYVGARYVPKIMGEWNKTLQYEALSIVTYKGNSFTSKIPVPSGVEISNNDYWVSTGNYNAQIENYRGITEELYAKYNKSIDYVTPEQFGAIGDGLHDDTSAIQSAINSGKTLVGRNTYLITRPLLLDNAVKRHYIFDFSGASIISNNDIECNLKISGLSYSNVMIGSVRSKNIGIKIYNNNTFESWCQYDNFYIDSINSAIDIEIETSNKMWINQLNFYNTHLSGNGIGINVKNNSSEPLNNYTFNCVGFEQLTTGISINSEHSTASDIMFNSCRVQENITTLIGAVGTVNNVLWNGSSSLLNLSLLNVNKNCDNWVFNIDNKTVKVFNGKIFNEVNTLNCTGGYRISNEDLNNITDLGTYVCQYVDAKNIRNMPTAQISFRLYVIECDSTNTHKYDFSVMQIYTSEKGNFIRYIIKHDGNISVGKWKSLSKNPDYTAASGTNAKSITATTDCILYYNIKLTSNMSINVNNTTISYYTITEPTLVTGSIILSSGDICKFYTEGKDDTIAAKIVPYI
mgnify:CR=1 FL=1|nr:MAG TPA: tailspike protein [Bacteriophage sp.]